MFAKKCFWTLTESNINAHTVLSESKHDLNGPTQEVLVNRFLLTKTKLCENIFKKLKSTYVGIQTTRKTCCSFLFFSKTKDTLAETNEFSYLIFGSTFSCFEPIKRRLILPQLQLKLKRFSQVRIINLKTKIDKQDRQKRWRVVHIAVILMRSTSVWEAFWIFLWAS